METLKAFLNIPRQEAGYRPVEDRITDFSQVEQTLNSRDRKLQASRCMDCGVPFCHWACPLGNKDPEFQAALSQGKWEMAYRILSQTNDFPEFTGRICPALCEKSCVLKLSFDAPVTIRENEAAIAEAAFREGYIQPQQPVRNGKRVAVIGAGPAGLSTAVRLNAQGFEVTIFDKNPMPGGLLRYGIPNFKLPKEIIDRRMRLLKKEGIHMEMGVTVDVEKLPEGFDAYALCTGTPEARDLNIPGRELKGIYFALDMLAQQNRILDGETFSKEQLVNARGKKVLVIGGGDTGSDCIGTSIRQGAVSVTQIEIMPKPPVGHNPATPWPQWPVVLKTTSSHEEGCTRRWSLNSTKFIGRNGRVTGVEVEEVEWITDTDSGRPVMKATGKKEIIEADMVLLAMGFLKPRHPELPSNVVIAGDAATGASLVVKCLADGRRAAKDIEQMLSEKEK